MKSSTKPYLKKYSFLNFCWRASWVLPILVLLFIPKTYAFNLGTEQTTSLTMLYWFIAVSASILCSILLFMRWTMMLRQQMIVFLVLPSFLVISLILGYGTWQSSKHEIAKVKKTVQQTAMLDAERLDAQLREIAKVAEITAKMMSFSTTMTEEDLYHVLQENIQDNRFIYGAAIAFEPGIFADRQRFSPYVYRHEGAWKHIDITHSYDYLATDVEWYHAAKTSGKALWTEPYFDDGAGNIYMTTYSVPIKRQGHIIGVATVDVSLTDMMSFAGIRKENTEKVKILSKTQHFIFHHAKEMLGKPLLDETAFPLSAKKHIAKLLNLKQAG